MFAPRIGFAVPHDVLASLFPTGDGCVQAGRGLSRDAARIPPIQNYWLARRVILITSEWNTTIGGAEVLTVCEMVRMGAEQVRSELAAQGDLDLRQDRVRLEIYAHRHSNVFRAKHSRARKVDKRVGPLENL